jgi:hypothetical protein
MDCCSSVFSPLAFDWISLFPFYRDKASFKTVDYSLQAEVPENDVL